jgi:hypothetical protein
MKLFLKRRILRFDGFDFAEGNPDYNYLEEKIYRNESSSLRFVSWLLNVQINGTVELLCQEI